MSVEPETSSPFSLRRIILGVLTLLVALVIGQALVNSWQEPQIASRLQLYQTDLLLEASEWDSSTLPEQSVTTIRQGLLGNDPIQTSLQQYQEVKATAEANLEASQNSGDGAMPGLPTDEAPQVPKRLRNAWQQQQQLVQQLDMRIGLLQAERGNLKQAQAAWSQLSQAADVQPGIQQTAQVLSRLWQEPAQVMPEAETQVQTYLDGWFRYRALERLYQVAGDDAAREALLAQERDAAEQTLLRLAVIGILPFLGGLAGTALLLFVVLQRWLQREQSWLMTNAGVTWDTPWSWEIIWQVLIVGFFFLGQIFLPLILGSLGLGLASLGSRGRALYATLYYLLMAAGGLAVLFFSIRAYRPLPPDWFRIDWKGGWRWGLGGYLAALPLMFGISLVNQQLWQGQGGSNPLLQTVLEENDAIALALFFFTAAIAAPVFEEILFRGFLLPSLTRYLPVSAAIGASSLLFATAHLSLSEVLPLTVLGIVLGTIYTRCRNLLAPILLHSAWNSITMAGLLLLGAG
ncbi:hypothetical protein XM38_017060 [Halomicronema hongdechloris C2206]|uniref:CAAX prenyl protease 2/Lysostaphin resistance protein A-like domain-containing protein n=1 Tax=Halomicronema hongdechloris C2206 TaxID=1641165 RepID=A0A1Z3HKD5_9CYAN|nr:type II CAAX endopeptidase family protein [Halomicronema hongdechloris]ASC70760.1 hypothetical protein XM38_017060 [Halomicronema hongdechloris C2206]